ncbi:MULTISPECIES: hypothetical protein [unclassified Pseudoclavibacter]|uniref:hypothetical protein n=1 Tax=unclassified Pseudoclavibacter TaxID=2615177 RepID=UPI0015E3A3FC|nr:MULTISPECIES: hypothetical protein [unclassified Pseudoclavibacter]
MSNAHTPADPSRRTVLTALSWSAPVLALSASVPAAVASTTATGGTLTLNGGSSAGEGIFFAGSNYDGSSASGPYTAQQLQVIVTVPTGVPFTTSAAPAGFDVSVDGNVVTLTNTTPLPAGEQTPVLGDFFISGSFAVGTSYTVRVAPTTITTTFTGLAADGTF